MATNLFTGFRLFVELAEPEDGEDKGSFLAHSKKTFGVAKKLWLGMPLLLSNTKLGDYKVIEPKMFYVKDYDDTSVTLTNVLNPMTEKEPGEDDPDDEIDMEDDTEGQGQVEITISREDFEDLQKPQTFPGMDTMSLRLGGGM